MSEFGVAQEQELRERSGSAGSDGSIPVPLTALIGRAAELDGITEALKRSRLVTLTGPGGVGKTRTAVEIVRRRVPHHADGVWLADLSSVAAHEEVASEIARVLDLQGAMGDRTKEMLKRHLADRDTLLLLDNCEHVVDSCAQLGADLLGACAKLRILATSREPLGMTGEVVWRLEPLAAADAYRLFIQRASERRPGLVPDPHAEAAIANICAKVDHLPLGIELAAARISLMSPEEIDASLDAHLSELSGTHRLAPARHRSTRAAVEWSYSLLDSVEQAAFRSLAVFVGSFDADAARAVAPGMTFDVLARLVDKSLVAVLAARGNRTRYRLLETMREYAAEQLDGADEIADARAKHVRHFSTIGIPVEDGWMSARLIPFLDERAADYGNVRTAIEWAAVSEPSVAARLLAETKDLFFMLGQADGRRLAELVLRGCPGPNRYTAEVTIAAGAFAFQLGDIAAAVDLMTTAADMGAALDDHSVEGTARWYLGLHGMLGGAADRGRGQLAIARALQQETGDRLGEARTTAAMGLTHLMDGEPARARELIEAALDIGRATQDRWSQGQANLYLGLVAESAGELRAAAVHFRESVDCTRPYGDATLLPVALVGQASVMAKDDPARALKVVAAASAIRARNGGGFAPFYRALAEGVRSRAVKGVGTEDERLWREGSRLTVDDAIALAFGAPGSARRRTARDLGVSGRELEVAHLVAEGLSNKEIASRLHLSVRTVESHVRHLLTKANISNRTQLARWVRDRD
ncbi:MAG: hypothetical protein QOJ19_423 [Acidimicrobiia bacterium]|nr:hypothetical protein [Acidimicrobiia bacterium]